MMLSRIQGLQLNEDQMAKLTAILNKGQTTLQPLRQKVAEAAVTPMPHEIKGQALYAFVTLKEGIHESDDLKKELVAHVRREIGPIAAPDVIQFAPALPKTRSGKIMRRILRKIAENSTDNLGDITTLADPGVVEILVKGRGK